MSRNVLLVFLGIVTAANVFALPKDDIDKLIEISKLHDSDERLQAYDRFVNGLEAEASTGVDQGKWLVSVESNKFDDTKEFSSTIYAEESNVVDSPTLTVRLKDGRLELFVFCSAYLGDEKNIRYRIDKNDPVFTSWSGSTSSRALFAPNAKALIEDLTSAQTMIVEVYPYSEGPKDFTFDVKGFDNVLIGLKKKGFNFDEVGQDKDDPNENADAASGLPDGYIKG